jgi:hypothetical protein
VLVEEQEDPVLQADPLPHAVAENEAAESNTETVASARGTSRPFTDTRM